MWGGNFVSVDLHFFEDYRCKASFPAPVCHLYLFFGKNVYWDLCPFLNELGFLFAIQLYEFFIYFRYKPLTKHMDCKYFLLFRFISLCFILFTSAIIPVVTICLSFVLRIRIQKIISEIAVKEVSICFFQFCGFSSSTQGLMHFEFSSLHIVR